MTEPKLEPKKHWADDVASKVVLARTQFTVATGITPSGHIHVGNLREVATADAVVRALQAQGKNVKFIYIADTFDPLRKVYPFLDEKVYAQHVGKPLSEIPAPNGQDASYAEQFLKPFLHALEQLEIKVEVWRADEAYKKGLYTQNIIKALKGRQRIREILKEETGKVTPEDWSPFVPICEKCKKMNDTSFKGFDEEAQTVAYTCVCGHSGNASMNGGGKLTWRVDWPARWQILGVSVEPFGKDHASRGGSYDTGIKITKEIFGYEPPFPVVYEWIGLKGQGDMSSSKGNVLSVREMIDVVPPEVLKYYIFKSEPLRHMMFDPGLPLISLLDEFDDPESKQKNIRAFELARLTHLKGSGVPFGHILTLYQMYQGDVSKIESTLKTSGFNPDHETLVHRLTYAKRWLEKFAPEDMKFSIQKDVPPSAHALGDKQKQALQKLSVFFSSPKTAKDIHEGIYAIKNELGIEPNDVFKAVYQSILGKDKGPRAGLFLASLEPAFLQERFQKVSKL